MVSLLAALGTGWCALGAPLALPPNRVIDISRPSLPQRSPSPLPSSIDSLIWANLKLNYSVTIPTPIGDSNDFWRIECDPDTTPPGWLAPPVFQQTGDLYDCNRAIYQVTRGGGDPLQPQLWTEPADWSYRSCGVFLAPGRVFTRVNFPRIDIFEIAQEVLRKCIAGGTTGVGLKGGWSAIGGYFIVLVTGTGQM